MSSISKRIRSRLVLQTFPHQPRLQAYLAASNRPLGDLSGSEPPYWAYCWAGGAALSAHIEANPSIVAGKKVIDYGAGNGRVGMTAALNGASRVIFAERDAHAREAIKLNCAANAIAGVSIVRAADREMLNACDIVLCGDVFYAQSVAEHSLELINIARSLGKSIIVGDPQRKYLPKDWTPVAVHEVPDFGMSKTVKAGIYTF